MRLADSQALSQPRSLVRLIAQPRGLAAAVLVIFLGGVGVSSALGLWATESSKVPATYTVGAYAGQANPADIRGSYTLGNIVKHFPVPLGDLVQAFALQDIQDPSSFAVKGLEGRYASQEYEVGASSVRLFVALYAGLPYESTEATYLFDVAAEILKAKGQLSSDQLAYLNLHTIASPAPDRGSAATSPAPEGDRTVKGKTTFQELMDWGLSREAIEQVTGKKLPGLQTGLADFCSQNNLELSSIKSALQAKLQP